MVKEVKTANYVSRNGIPFERNRTRWLMLVYDSIFFTLCWLIWTILLPFTSKDSAPLVCWVQFGIGYVLIFGLRLALKSYKRILRYGSVHAFSRDLLSCVIASCLWLLLSIFLGRTTPELSISIPFLLSFTAAYTVLSVFIRIGYCRLYWFAKKEKWLSKMLRKILKVCTWVDFNSKMPGAVLHLSLEPEKRQVSPINELQNIAEQFAIRGDITAITQINKGYINRTYKVETLSDTGHVHKYTLQRINTNVFPDVDALMDNFKLTTDWLFGRLMLAGRRKKGCVQSIRPTKDGRSYLRDDSGCWRMLTHFDNVYSLDIPDSPDTFYHAGYAFGSFMKEMTGVDVADVKEVIPNFHNTKSRYYDLEDAIARDPKGRVKQVQPEIGFVRARVDNYSIISDALERGRIPTRICHNDCNLNNILFDNETHLPVAIIDLDTVMPSSPLYDYGDSMRIGTNTAADDEKDLTKVSCDLNLYEKYARGYLEACGHILTKEELALLPYASIIIASEDGIRFLMDYINGDTYYNIYYPGQNLDRSRTQLKLVEDMERKLPQIKHILRGIYQDLGLDATID